MNAVVFLTDKKFVDNTKFMIKQVSRFDSDIPKYVLTDDSLISSIDKDTWDLFSDNKTKLINSTNVLTSVGVGQADEGGWPPVVCARLLIPFLDQFSEYDKILYLDSDISIRKDFRSIFDIDLQQHEVGAVEDFNQNNYAKKSIQKLENISGMKLRTKYINSGVLLFNNKFIRTNGLFNDRLRELVRITKLGYEKHFEYIDQDIVNLLFDITLLPDIYNRSWYRGARPDDIFFHYLGDGKAVFRRLMNEH